jgi:hypothetical protein
MVGQWRVNDSLQTFNFHRELSTLDPGWVKTQKQAVLAKKLPTFGPEKT